MKDFVFILGKNLDLSIAEIVSYLEREKIRFSIMEKGTNFLVIRLDDLNEKAIDELGGTIKIGEILYAFEFKDIKASEQMFQEIDFSPVFSELPDRLVFGVSSYGIRDWKLFAKILKKKMKKFGIKLSYFNISKERSWMTHIEVIKKKLLEDSIEFLICRGKNLYIGKTVGVHNPFEFQKRDVERPYQRTIFSIPPRLARIMINLSKVNKGDLLVDPFCGIGGILQEALVSGIKIKGFDVNSKCVNQCKKNLEWLSKEYKIKIPNIDDLVIKADSMKLSSYLQRNSVDAIVTEPYLGPPLKRKPAKFEAINILKELDVFYGRAIREMVKVLKPGKRIVIVSPCFRIGKEIEGIDIDKIVSSIEHGEKAKVIDPVSKYGIKHKFPLYDFEQRHKTLRQINVIEKLR
jgi:tRNA G10  N-methylase Trm11